ncbi:MAG: Fe-S cluster assembly sulfur transfer protein SufU [Thermoplasmatota archaeon]
MNLYQDVIMEHNRFPRGFGPLDGATHVAHGHNPLCGDNVVVRLKMAGEQVQDAAFEGVGCAICKASASMMMETLKESGTALAEPFLELLRTGKGDLGKLQVFETVWNYPARVKCAALPWRTMQAALAGTPATTTEET